MRLVQIGLTRFTIPSLSNQKFQFFSSNLQNPRFSEQSHASLANLLQRYGFPCLNINNFISKNRFLHDSNLDELEKSLAVLSSFNFNKSCLVSLISDCPGVLDYEFVKKWEIGFWNLGILSASPLMVKRVLEESKRFQIGPDCVLRIVKALRGLGFKDGTLSRVLEGFPCVILMNEREIKKRVEFLVGLGIPRDDVDRVLCCLPGVLGFGVEDKLEPLLSEFRGFGFSDDVIRREIIREPRVLGMELGEFSRCLEWLRTLKCREPVKEKIFSDGEFQAAFEVKLRVDCLCNNGLIRTEAFEVLWKEPRSIIYKVEDIVRKIEFLLHTMKFNIHCLVEVPEYLGVNYEKQIVPRYNVIEHLQSKGGLGSEVGLKGLIKPSRLRFYNLYVKPYPDCEKIFGRLSGDGKVGSQHPAGLWKLFKPPSYPQSKDEVMNTRSFFKSLGH